VESAVRETRQGKGSSLDQLRPLACAGNTHPQRWRMPRGQLQETKLIARA
jgi:hypothetical protein